MSRVYEILGYVAVIDAVGKNDGHTAVAIVHPGGISIQTLLNLDPDGLIKFIPFGNPGSAIDKDTLSAVHSIVPFGQVVLFVPFDPVGPCGPVEPLIVLLPQISLVLFSPFVPARGILPVVVTNDADNALIVMANGTLAVVVTRE